MQVLIYAKAQKTLLQFNSCGKLALHNPPKHNSQFHLLILP